MVQRAVQCVPVGGDERAWTMGLGVQTTPIPGVYGAGRAIDADCICHDGDARYMIKIIVVLITIK